MGRIIEASTNGALIMPPSPNKCRLLIALHSKASATHMTAPQADSAWKGV